MFHLCFFLIFSAGSIGNATYTVEGNIQSAQVSTVNASPPPPPPPPPTPPAIQVNPQAAAPADDGNVENVLNVVYR